MNIMKVICIWERKRTKHCIFTKVRFVGVEKMGEGPKMEMMYFQDFTYQEVERTKKFLRDQWLGEILEIYKVITSFQIDLR